jgi:hypothetical protein
LPNQILNGSIRDLQFNILVAGTGIEEDIKQAKKANKRK